MKIAMLTSDYLPNIGGIASHIYELSKALISIGHDVEVWFWDRKGRTLSTEQLGDVPVRPIDMPRKPSQNRGPLTALRLVAPLKKNIAAFPADILHVHTLNPLMLSMRWIRKTYRGRIVWTNHSSRYLRKMDSFPWMLKMKFYLRGFDGLHAPSKELFEKSRMLKNAPGRLIYIPNGVDVSKFKQIGKAEARQKLDLPQDKFIIVSTRRFSPKNGIRFLAQALHLVRQEIPEVLCIFCGNLPDAKDWPVVTEIVDTHKLSSAVRFEGAVPNEKIYLYLNAADLVVLPSLMEATSISGLEAMAVGRPLVGTSIGGIPQLIENETSGILVEPADAQSLADGILRIKRLDKLEEMGNCAREIVMTEFTWEIIAKRFTTFYQTLATL